MKDTFEVIINGQVHTIAFTPDTESPMKTEDNGVMDIDGVTGFIARKTSYVPIPSVFTNLLAK